MLRREHLVRVAMAVAVLGGLALFPVSAAAFPGAASSCPAGRPLITMSVGTVPVVPGARLVVDGKPVVTDGAGRATMQVCRLTSAKDITGPKDPIALAGQRRAVYDRVFLSNAGRSLQAAFGIDAEVSFAFSGIPSKKIEQFVLRSSTGQVITRTTLDTVYLPSTRVLRGPDGLEERQIYYSVDSVNVAGSSVVNRSQVKFFPSDRAVVRVPLLAFDVRVEVVDRLFRWPTGSSVRLARKPAFGEQKLLDNGVASFPEVPRGEYSVIAEAPGLPIARNLTLSKDQIVVMPVLTWIDLIVLVGVPLLIAMGLVVAPRPLLRQRLARAVPRPRRKAGPSSSA